MEPKLDESGMVRDLPFTVSRNVCMLLNNPNLENNYKMLAGVMGYGVNEIKTFGQNENPADNLLQHWGTKKESTNGRLVEYLNSIGRSDVVDVLCGRESCSKNEKPREGVTNMPMVRDMGYLLRQGICLELNLLQEIDGKDYRMFAQKVGINRSQMIEISRKKNPMDEVLTCWETKNEATMDRMKQILLEMGRIDLLEKLA